MSVLKAESTISTFQEGITPMTAETPACFAIEFEGNRRENN
jgi:hypothetical protein